MTEFLIPDIPNPNPSATNAQEAFQSDFSGGENSVSDPLFLRDNETSLQLNVYQRRGGGLTARKGYKSVGAGSASGQGRAIFEIDQSMPTILTYDAGLAAWYEEEGNPNFSLFLQTPATGDQVLVGSREKYNSLILNLLLAYTTSGNTFVWEASNGASGFIDKTSSIVEAVANSKQMRGATGEWLFSWPDFSDWLPDFVNGPSFSTQCQYWLKIRCTTGGTNGGAVVRLGQKRIRGGFIGRRIIVGASLNSIDEWPGFGVARENIASFGTAVRIDRIRGAVFNDYFYFASGGQRPLLRWNGARGTTRAASDNSPKLAGLSVPAAFSGGNLTQSANSSAYPVGVVLRYVTAYEWGPEGILGESGPCTQANNEITISGATNQVAISLANAIGPANALEVSAIRLYATDDLSGTQVAERSDPNGFYLIARILKDDATWVAGTLTDTYLPRTKTEKPPLNYVNTPPFYPKYVTEGGGRLWIADDYNVAWSDIGRGDAWDPFNQAKFNNVRGLHWRKTRMLVFHDNDIRFIADVNTGLPNIDFFYRGLGTVQADSITVAENKVLFMSRLGPAAIFEDDNVGLLGSGRVHESSVYWNSIVGERNLAQGAFFNRRWFIPIDQGGPNQYVGRTACLDLQGPGGDRGAWSRMLYKEGTSQEVAWAALAVVHAPLDHALARQLVLVGFPDANGSAQTPYMKMLEYGTTDNWTTVATDGQKISAQVESKGLPMLALNRWKTYRNAHIRYKMAAAGTVSINANILADMSATASRLITVSGGSTFVRDLKFLCSEGATSGLFRDVASRFHVDASTDSGFELFSFWLDAMVEDFSLL